MPDSTLQQYQQALACFEKNEWQKAELLSMELHSRQPFFADNLNLIARIKYQLGKVDEAILFAEASVVLMPQNQSFLSCLNELNRMALHR